MPQIFNHPVERLMIDMWKQNSMLEMIAFSWSDKHSKTVLTLHDKTYDQALKMAKEQGYTEWKWYKPWTWDNTVWWCQRRDTNIVSRSPK